MITVGGVGGREGDSSSSGGGDAVVAANTPDLMPDTDRSGEGGIELGDGTSIRGCGVVGRESCDKRVRCNGAGDGNLV